MFKQVVYTINTAASDLAYFILRNFGDAKLHDENIPQQFNRFLFGCQLLILFQVYSPAYPLQ